MRLLIVEDNDRLVALLERLFREHGHVVDAFSTVDEAIAALDAAPYDAIVLDLTLPDGEGADVLRAVRQKGEGTPVLIASARADVLERIKLLDQGADDYLVKPFLFDELLARLRALQRRPPLAPSQVLSAGNVELDTAAMAVSVAGQTADIPRRELMVLETLMRNQGHLLSREKILNAIYALDAEVTPNAVEAAISRLRRRLETHNADITITAMRGLGYIMTTHDSERA